MAATIYKMRYHEREIILRLDHVHGKATKFHIRNVNDDDHPLFHQIVYIPTSCIREIGDGYLAPVDWFWDNWTNRRKLNIAGYHFKFSIAGFITDPEKR